VAPADRATRRSAPRRPTRAPTTGSAAVKPPAKPTLTPTKPTIEPVEELAVEIVTFGFKFGLPDKADLVFDVRFLTNPFWVPDLKPLSGLSAPVRAFVLEQPQAERFLDLVVQLLELTVPAYRGAGRRQLTVALGCTGGYHRSIALAEELASRLGGLEGASVSVMHRELGR
jgi:RNase adapter protein RapZ